MLATISLRIGVLLSGCAPVRRFRDEETATAPNSSLRARWILNFLRHLSRQDEPAVHLTVEEPRNLRNPPVWQAKYVDRPEPEHVIVRVLLVARESRLPVRADRHQPPRDREHPFGEEAADSLPALEPGRQRRHGEPGVLREQAQNGVHIGPFPGGHER